MTFNNYYLQLSRRLMLFVTIITAVIILSGCGAQAAPKVYRVGILSGLEYISAISEGFKSEMAELGYVEGQNIVYDVQKTDFDLEAYKRILQKFVADKVDLIVVYPTEAAMEAKIATQGTDIPVIFNFAFIEGADLIDSIREPGGNITGVRYPGPDIMLKRFEIMRQLAPEAKRMLLPYQKGYPIVNSQLEALRPVAGAMGVTLIEMPVANVAELEAELQARAKLADIGLDAILLLVEPLAVTPDAFVVMGKFAAEQKIPLGGAFISAEGYDSIFGVNADPLDTGKRAAPLADKIFKGIPAGTIPVISAESNLEINYKAAQALGLTVPEGLLSQADTIIR